MFICHAVPKGSLWDKHLCALSNKIPIHGSSEGVFGTVPGQDDIGIASSSAVQRPPQPVRIGNK